MPTPEDFETPCKLCKSYNPLVCSDCKNYKKWVIENSPGISAAIKVTRTVEQYWENKMNEIKNDGLFTWEDYETD